MTYVIILWSCALGQPLCTHPDATWSGLEYDSQRKAAVHFPYEIDDFHEANPTRQVIKFEVMTLERWEFERGEYNCSHSGPTTGRE